METDVQQMNDSDSDVDRIFAKQQLREALRQKVELKKSDPLRFYRPHAKQDMFHQMGHIKHRAVFAGNRFGKSAMGVAEDAAFVQGCRPWYPVGHPARLAGIPQRPVKLLIITTDWDKVDEIFTSERGEMGKLWRMLPRGFVKAKKRNHSGAIEMMEMENGAIIRFDTVKSFEVNPQGSESSDWDAIHIDEPCSEEQYKAASRGLIDRNGCDWFTLTPLKEPWIYDKFFSRDDFEQLDKGIQNNNHWAIRGSTYDNTYLSAEAIKDYEDSLSEDEKQCRLEGVPLELSGMVFKEFSYAKHVYKEIPNGWEDFQLPPANWPVIVSIDPHPQTASMVLFQAISPHNELFFFNEIFRKLTVLELCEEIKVISNRFRSVRFICDPWVFTEHALTGQCIARDMSRFGVPVTKASKDLQGGILLVKQELKTPGRLNFSMRLKNTLYEFSHYVWAERENKPRDKDDHAMECLRRIIQEKPRWWQPSGISSIIPELSIKITQDDLLKI